MQLDRAVIKKLEHNGMVVALTALYDQELDRSGFEVSKSLAGKLLVRVPYDDRSEASQHFDELVKETGANPSNIE